MPLEYALQFRGKLPVASPWKKPVPTKRVILEPDELGISGLASQSVKLAKKRAFRLNLMVVGESGLGKTTFINTLFATDLLPHQKRVITEKTAKITPHHFELEEDGVHLHLSVIDTPGFGDQINREDSLLPILQYLTDQYDKYTEEETNRGFRRTVTDTRVHALLYFISPNCHRLKELDLASLKQLSSKVNVIPVVAKADTMTSEEKAELKAKILGDLSKYDVRLYPTAYSEDREEIEAVEAHQPFCVIGADKYLDVGNGKYVRGRQYKWGLVDVENTNHCDFVHLRSLLISSNLNDLTETTHSVHYLNYRASKLRTDGRRPSILQSDDQYEMQVEQVRRQFQEEMSIKEKEMREQIYRKVKEKEAALRESEEALARKEKELMADINEQKRLLEAEEKEIELAYQRIAAAKKKSAK